MFWVSWMPRLVVVMPEAGRILNTLTVSIRGIVVEICCSKEELLYRSWGFGKDDSHSPRNMSS